MYLLLIGPTRAHRVIVPETPPHYRHYDVTSYDGLDSEVVAIENEYIVDHVAESIARNIGLHLMMMRRIANL
jgi:hypothetical protein